MEMREWRFGDVCVRVIAPEGVPIGGVHVTLTPEDRAQFLAAAEAVGGLGELTLPEYEASYPQAALVFAKGEDGERNYEIALSIREPPRERADAEKRVHPFFGPVAERVERERSEEGAEKAPVER